MIQLIFCECVPPKTHLILTFRLNNLTHLFLVGFFCLFVLLQSSDKAQLLLNMVDMFGASAKYRGDCDLGYGSDLSYFVKEEQWS